MNRADKRRIKKYAEHIWNLEKKIEEARRTNSQYIETLMYELTKYVSNLSFEDMILIDEYLIETHGEAS